MSRRSIPMSIRVARTALPAVLAFALAVVLATADLSTGSGGAGSEAEGWISSSPTAHGIATTALPAPLTPPFAAPQTFPVGTNPTGVTAGDFDSDGNQDVATSNSLSDNVAALLGAGDGSFGAAAFYPVGFEPTAVTVAHFNADQHLDIATANSVTADVSVLLGNGDGTFQPEVFFAVGAFPLAILAGDYNEDGFTEIATANAFFDDVSILLGNGDGTFQDELFFPAGFLPIGLAQGDYNGDGNLDIAVLNLGDETVSILPGNGDGTFGADTGPFPVGTLPLISPASIATGDVNGDTRLDLVTANLDGNDVSILLGNGDGSFQAPQAHAVGVGPLSVTIADFDRNGTLDLATADIGSVTILLGNGDGTFMMAQMFLVDLEPFYVFASDVNDDDFPDIIVANSGDDSISVLINQFNRPPVADAGADQSIECGAPGGTAVTLDGSASSDPDDDAITYKWTGPFPEGGGVVEGAAPVVTLPLGLSEISLVVSDGTLESEANSVAIAVSDTTAPVLTGSFTPFSRVGGHEDDDDDGGAGGGHDDDDDGGAGGGHEDDDDDGGSAHGDDDDNGDGNPGDDDDDGGHGDDNDEDVLVVEFGASDACDPTPTVRGTLLVGTCLSLPATPGALVEFEKKKKCKLDACAFSDVIEIRGPSLALHVTGADASGNQATLDVPCVSPPSCDLTDQTMQSGAMPSGVQQPHPANRGKTATPRKRGR